MRGRPQMTIGRSTATSRISGCRRTRSSSRSRLRSRPVTNSGLGQDAGVVEPGLVAQGPAHRRSSRATKSSGTRSRRVRSAPRPWPSGRRVATGHWRRPRPSGPGRPGVVGEPGVGQVVEGDGGWPGVPGSSPVRPTRHDLELEAGPGVCLGQEPAEPDAPLWCPAVETQLGWPGSVGRDDDDPGPVRFVVHLRRR